MDFSTLRISFGCAFRLFTSCCAFRLFAAVRLFCFLLCFSTFCGFSLTTSLSGFSGFSRKFFIPYAFRLFAFRLFACRLAFVAYPCRQPFANAAVSNMQCAATVASKRLLCCRFRKGCWMLLARFRWFRCFGVTHPRCCIADSGGLSLSVCRNFGNASCTGCPGVLARQTLSAMRKSSPPKV